MIAVVTGAGGGIGAAVARRFAREGVRVWMLDRDGDALAAAAEPIRGDPLPCDVSDEGSVAEAVSTVLARGVAPHVLVNVAGINTRPGSVVTTAPDAWDAVIATNLRGTYLVSRALVPHLADGGAVVNVGSILALTGVRDQAAYTASKGAIVALTRAMAKDHAPRLRVNCVCPGAIATDMFEAYLGRTPDPDAERARIVAGIPLGRIGTPEDVADAVWFLANANWITGQSLVVDGGDTA